MGRACRATPGLAAFQGGRCSHGAQSAQATAEALGMLRLPPQRARLPAEALAAQPLAPQPPAAAAQAAREAESPGSADGAGVTTEAPYTPAAAAAAAAAVAAPQATGQKTASGEAAAALSALRPELAAQVARPDGGGFALAGRGVIPEV